MPKRPLTIEQVLTLLAETPPRIAALTAGLAPAQLRTAPNHDEWSANDVLAHLRACADMWGDCIVTACRSVGSPGTVAARRLVTCGDSYGGGKGTRADRAVLCGVAGCP